jgi:hypothetical protein
MSLAHAVRMVSTGNGGTAGLGAVTAMVFAVIAYATAVGALAVISSIRGFGASDDAGLRLVTGLALLAPAATVLVTTLRRPADR